MIRFVRPEGYGTRRLAPGQRRRGAQARVVRVHLLALRRGLLEDLGAEALRQQGVFTVAALVFLRAVPFPPAVRLCVAATARWTQSAEDSGRGTKQRKRLKQAGSTSPC